MICELHLIIYEKKIMHFSPTKKLGCALTSVPSFTLLFQAKTVKKMQLLSRFAKHCIASYRLATLTR
jgi:hypothetical protein